MAVLRIPSFVTIIIVLLFGSDIIVDCYENPWPETFMDFGMDDPRPFTSSWPYNVQNSYRGYGDYVRQMLNNKLKDMMKFSRDFVHQGNYYGNNFEQDPDTKMLLQQARVAFANSNSGGRYLGKLVRTASCGKHCIIKVVIGKINGNYYENVSKSNH
ncbi:uncharacterized protein LOC115214207 [Octopus sinensis]|uniref:Uncharacterized protein LOC115214207 n=1 Tax=Octopus sinensis TaxID=2607531 RepID=A0A6P7SLK8_9MOLL|nr:uncharacterized protein LOC115214207 [Octopus sinensis]